VTATDPREPTVTAATSPDTPDTGTEAAYRVVWEFAVRLDAPAGLATNELSLLADAAADQASTGTNWGELRLMWIDDQYEVWNSDCELTEPGDPRVVATVWFTASDPRTTAHPLATTDTTGRG
jgi:hypothetical protein